jgi:uncharacterized membrane protein YdjX (TVP38/TMEM64 family)
MYRAGAKAIAAAQRLARQNILWHCPAKERGLATDGETHEIRPAEREHGPLTSTELRSWMLIVLGLAAVAAAWFLLPVQAWLQAFGAWAAALGPFGPIAFAALFVLATLLVVPGTPLTIAGALAFGWWSLPLVLVSATLGAVLAVLAARSVLRQRVERLIARRPAMGATMEAVGDGGWRLLTLMRVSPFVPFNAQNYVLGLTRVRMRDFLVSTLLGMVPGTVLCVYLGVIGRSAGNPAAHWIPLGSAWSRRWRRSR